jgi:hypothetical protein
MRIGHKELRNAWDRARDDAGLDRRDCVVFLVKARMPHGRAEAGYYRPGGPDMPHDWLSPSVIRHVPPETLARYEHRHRVATWSEIPGAPYALLDPLLRHELEHAAQWQRHGRSFIDLDGHLRDVWGTDANPERYLRLPAEREANHERLLRRLRRRRRYRQVVDHEAPSLESDSLSLMVQALREAGDQFLPQLNVEQRKSELQSLEQNARNWPADMLDGLRDSEPDDVVVVTHPYRPAGAASPVAEQLGVRAEREYSKSSPTPRKPCVGAEATSLYVRGPTAAREVASS